MNNILKNILSYRRQHDSKGEHEFMIQFMNRFNRLDDPSTNEPIAFSHSIGDSKILWVSHIDTVHRKNPDQIHQQNFLDEEFNILYCDKSSDCLGADDGSGIALMLNMIDRGIEGNYLFTRGEEIGGVGAKALVKYHADYLKQFTHAISLDRKGNNSIITHQGFSRCCSDSFANRFAEILQTKDLNFNADDTGTYTDTAEFTKLIPECTNLSVGYMNQHTPNEFLDLTFWNQLLDRLCDLTRAELDSLPIDRDPSIIEELLWDDDFYYGSDDPDDPINSYYSGRAIDQKSLVKWIKKQSHETIANSFLDLLNELDSGYDRIKF